MFSYTENQLALPKESTGITVWKLSIPRRINEHYTAENKHTKLINEHYAVENEHYRKEPTRTTVWKTSIAQNINENYIAENEHNWKKRRALRWATRSLQKRINLSTLPGNGCSPGDQMGVEREGEQKERFPYKFWRQLVPLDQKADLFLLRKRNYVYLASERCIEPGSHG